MFKLFKFKADIYSIQYTGWKSEKVNTWVSVYWYLKPLKPDDSLYQWAFWKDYSFSTKINSWIKEADTLEIDWNKYDVKWVVPYSWFKVKYDRLLLVKI